ncbi:MAG: flagellar motor protein MotB [Candidatus Krumholzibacteriia bacterium]
MMTRNLVLVAVLAAMVALAGCSCKEYEDQILALDAQIADLQQQLGERESTLAECNDLTDELRKNLREAEMEHAVAIEQRDNRYIDLTLNDSVTFASSQWIVLDTMVPALQAIASTLRTRSDFKIYVEGHTDNKKIMEEFQDRWPSNWELGAFRAAAVTRYLTNELGLPAERFASVSYGPYQPVASNDTAAGRADNRRVVIRLEKINTF